MQTVSKLYKQSIAQSIRNKGYIKTSIGIINQTAQGSAYVDENSTNLCYFSSPTNAFNSYAVSKPYATCEEEFSKVDGTMYFAPLETSSVTTYYNQGIVTDDMMGSILILFDGYSSLDISGLTIDFGANYPTALTIYTDEDSKSYTNDSQYFSVSDAMENISYIMIEPTEMLHGENRLRINTIDMGIVTSFSNDNILSFSIKEHVSSLSDSISSIDMTLKVDNQNQYFSPDNDDSPLAYLEIGQEMTVQFGYDIVGDGLEKDIEWLPSQTAYLSEWSSDDTSATFVSTDTFDTLTNKYYGGIYSEDGISLYDLAIDVLTDAGITDSRDYYIDTYLKDITVNNPMPIVTHAEALQLIANAGRCVLFQDRSGRIQIHASIVPDVTVSSNSETDYSIVANTTVNTDKLYYAICSRDFSKVDGTMYFMPSDSSQYLYTGYYSDVVSSGQETSGLPMYLGAQDFFNSSFGSWSSSSATPYIQVDLEAVATLYGMQMEFVQVAPTSITIATYNDDTVITEETYTNSSDNLTFYTDETYEEFNKMIITFNSMPANCRVVVDKVLVGNLTNYTVTRNDMTSQPTVKRDTKIKDITVYKTSYLANTESRELASEELTLSEDTEYTIYLSNASYDFSITTDDDTVTASITSYTAYKVVVQFTVAAETTFNYSLVGYEYLKNVDAVTTSFNDTGDTESQTNPLVSTTSHATDIIEWLGEYYNGLVEYEIPWRGDPRLDANDLLYVEKKTGDTSLIRDYQNELTFNGAWSGKIKGRRTTIESFDTNDNLFNLVFTSFRGIVTVTQDAPELPIELNNMDIVNSVYASGGVALVVRYATGHGIYIVENQVNTSVTATKTFTYSTSNFELEPGRYMFYIEGDADGDEVTVDITYNDTTISGTLNKVSIYEITETFGTAVSMTITVVGNGNKKTATVYPIVRKIG